MARKKKTEKTDKYEGLKNLIKESGEKKTPVSENEDTYSIAPKGVLWCALKEIYGTGRKNDRIDDMDKLDDFCRLFLKGLSELSTGGKESDLFTDDFNSFFQLYVNALNLCGRMRQVLEDNGIDFDINGDGDDTRI